MVLAALAAALVAAALTAASATTLVWSTAVPVARGQPVTVQDLEPVEVAAETAPSLLEATVESRDQLIGRVWAANLPAGQLLSPPLTVTRLPVDDGRALVGLRLDPGGFPSTGLQPGDAVHVLAAPQQQGQPPELLTTGTVEAVVVLSDQGPASPRLVTVSVPTDSAAAVAAAGTADRASLAIVGSNAQEEVP